MFKEIKQPINEFFEDAKKNIDTYSKYVLMLPLPYCTPNGPGKFEWNDYGYFVTKAYKCLHKGYVNKCDMMKKWFFTDKSERMQDIFDTDNIFVYADADEEGKLTFENHPFARVVGCMCYDYDDKGQIQLNMHNIVSCCNIAFNEFSGLEKVVLILPGTTEKENHNPIVTLRNVFIYSPCEVIAVYNH